MISRKDKVEEHKNFREKYSSRKKSNDLQNSKDKSQCIPRIHKKNSFTVLWPLKFLPKTHQ